MITLNCHAPASHSETGKFGHVTLLFYDWTHDGLYLYLSSYPLPRWLCCPLIFIKNNYSVKPLWIKKPQRFIPEKAKPEMPLSCGLATSVWAGWETWWRRSWIFFFESLFGGACLMLLPVSACQPGCLKGGLEPPGTAKLQYIGDGPWSKRNKLKAVGSGQWKIMPENTGSDF